MNKRADIQKAMGVLIRDRKVLVARSRGKDFFVGPGGKLEQGETPAQALVRELKEELQIVVKEGNLTKLGTFTAPAAGNENIIVSAHVFVVVLWEGDITIDNEIEEVQWIKADAVDGIELGSIFLHDVLPKLKSMNLID